MPIRDRDWRDKWERDRQQFDRQWRWVWPLAITVALVFGAVELALWLGGAAWIWSHIR